MDCVIDLDSDKDQDGKQGLTEIGLIGWKVEWRDGPCAGRRDGDGTTAWSTYQDHVKERGDCPSAGRRVRARGPGDTPREGGAADRVGFAARAMNANQSALLYDRLLQSGWA